MLCLYFAPDNSIITDKMNEPIQNIQSPCVRRCCLDDDDICLGCHRSITEIMGWNEADEAERQRILQRCRVRQQQRREQGKEWYE